MNEQYFDLYLTPLSPLHLGTDEDYTPTNYVMDELGLHEFDVLAAMAVMGQRERSELNQILSGQSGERMILSLQKFFAKHGEALRGESLRSVQVAEGVLGQYQARLGRVANREQSGRGVINALEIERTFYNPVSSEAIIPGSGIKGAIRTALLSLKNKKNPLPHDLKRDKGANKKLQNKLFEFEQRNMHQDPLRLLKLKDATVRNSSLATRKVYFAVNRKRSAPKGKEDPRNGGPTQRLESLTPLAPRAYRGAISVVSMSDYRHQYADKVPKIEFSLEQIVDACNHFYRPLLEREIGGMEREGYLDPDWKRSVEQILDTVDKRSESKRAFLLRVGRHSGAEAVTIEGVRDIKIMQGPGNKPRYQDKATTWWMASEQEDALIEMLPYGWVLVELTDPGFPPDKLPVLDELAQQRIDENGSWLEKLEGQRHIAREKRLEKQQIEQERAEQHQREEAEKEQREKLRAEMSAEQLMVDDLRARFEGERDAGNLQPQGEVAQKRIELLKAALEWEDAEAQGLAYQLLVEIAKEMPWSKKSKKERKSQLEQLANSAHKAS